MARPFPSHVAVRHLAQLFVDERNELPLGEVVSAAPGKQELGELGVFVPALGAHRDRKLCLQPGNTLGEATRGNYTCLRVWASVLRNSADSPSSVLSEDAFVRICAQLEASDSLTALAVPCGDQREARGSCVVLFGESSSCSERLRPNRAEHGRVQLFESRRSQHGIRRRFCSTGG